VAGQVTYLRGWRYARPFALPGEFGLLQHYPAGDQVTVTPLGTRDPDVGDVVLVRCRGHEYLHLVKARQGDRFLIGNNRGGLNSWVGRRAIFGVLSNARSARPV
jgi:hypothetical protein